jgi:hypothetical protein
MVDKLKHATVPDLRQRKTYFLAACLAKINEVLPCQEQLYLPSSSLTACDADRTSRLMGERPGDFAALSCT